MGSDRNRPVLGTFKWFSVKNGHHFTNPNDTQNNVFDHQMATTWNNPQKITWNVGEDKAVELDIVTAQKRERAINMTEPDEEET